jgi:hypothetical protein
VLTETRNLLEQEPAASLTPWKTVSTTPNGNVSTTPGIGKEKEQLFFGKSFALEVLSQAPAIRDSLAGIPIVRCLNVMLQLATCKLPQYSHSCAFLLVDLLHLFSLLLGALLAVISISLNAPLTEQQTVSWGSWWSEDMKIFWSN